MNLLRIVTVTAVLLHPRADLPAHIKPRCFLGRRMHITLVGLESSVLLRAVRGLIKVKNTANLLLPPRLEIRELKLAEQKAL